MTQRRWPRYRPRTASGQGNKHYALVCFFGPGAACSFAIQELTDQALQYDRRLGGGDHVAGGKHRFVGTSLYTQVLLAEQAAGQDFERAVFGKTGLARMTR